MDPALPFKVTIETSASVVAVVARSPEQRALTQEVLRAVTRLNDVSYAGQGREITFSIDRTTRLPVVKVVNSETKEILEQWPAQYVLQLARSYAESSRIQDEHLL